MYLSARSVLPLFAAAITAACATHVAAPVSDRQLASPTPAAPRPGYYVVKAGDTLHRIAQTHGVTFQDLAAWNKLDDPNRLEVGHELRVVPPDGVQIQAIQSNAPVEVKPLGSTEKPPEPVPAAPQHKSGPLGGVRPYTDEAWAALQPTPVVPPSIPKAAPPESSPPRTTDSRSVDGVDWSWPNDGKLIGQFSDSGTRKGLDLAGKTGDPVLAAASGKVVYAGTGLRGYGKLIIIKHDSNYLSAYAHNDQLMVKEGDSVGKGQQIATLGSSDSDRPKLHFEIRRQGKPVDPSKYLPSR